MNLDILLVWAFGPTEKAALERDEQYSREGAMNRGWFHDGINSSLHSRAYERYRTDGPEVLLTFAQRALELVRRSEIFCSQDGGPMKKSMAHRGR